VLRPAFASSVSASAASVAEYIVAAPASRAACRSWPICSEFAIVAAPTADIDLSKSIAAFAAIPNAASIAPPRITALWLDSCIACLRAWSAAFSAACCLSASRSAFR
jgi:hypothetical protein